jgi:hypothetical protein
VNSNHPLLERKLLRLEKLAGDSDEKIIFNFTTGGMGLIAANKSRGYAGILCVSDVTDIHTKIHSYDVNVNKWIWAEEEGFSRDQIVSDPLLKNEIFKRTSFLKFLEKLLK